MQFNIIHTANVAQKGNLAEHTQLSNTSEIEHQTHGANLLPPRVYSMLYHAGMLTDQVNTPISKYHNHCILNNNNSNSNNNSDIDDTTRNEDVNKVVGHEQHSTTLTRIDLLHDAHHTVEHKLLPQTQTPAMTPCVSIREFSRDQFATATQTPSTHSSSKWNYINWMQQRQQQHQVQTHEQQRQHEQQTISHMANWNKWSSERNSEHHSKMTHSTKINRTLNTSVTIGEDYGISPESHSMSNDIRAMQTPSLKPGSTHDSIRLAYTQLQPSRSRMRASLSPPIHTHRNLFSTFSHDMVCNADKSETALPVSTEVTESKLIHTHAYEPPSAIDDDVNIHDSIHLDNNYDDVNRDNRNEIDKYVVLREKLAKLNKEEMLELLYDVLTYCNNDEKLYNLIRNTVNHFSESNDTCSNMENHKIWNNVCVSCKASNNDDNSCQDKCVEKAFSPIQEQIDEIEPESGLEKVHTPPLLAETIVQSSNAFNMHNENNAFPLHVKDAIQTRGEYDTNSLAVQLSSLTPHSSTSGKSDCHKLSNKNVNICNSVASDKKMPLCDVNPLTSFRQQQQQQQQQQELKVPSEIRAFTQELHPCLQEYGNCRYPRTCPFALLPRNFCLNWLYNECDDGLSCLQVHRLPEYCPEVVQNLYNRYHGTQNDILQQQDEEYYQHQQSHQVNSAITPPDRGQLVQRITPKQEVNNVISLSNKRTSLHSNVKHSNTPMTTFTNTPWANSQSRQVWHVKPTPHFVQPNITCNSYLPISMSPFCVVAGTQDNSEAELNRRVCRSLNDSFDRVSEMR